MTNYFKEKDKRVEFFEKYYIWSLKFLDCDPAIWITNYLHDRFEHNTEQRYWLSWLYGNTYNLPSAWIMLNEFPDFECVDQERIDWWNTENFKNIPYQTDTKWSKGHLGKMFASYKKEIRGVPQEEFFMAFMTDDKRESFDNVWDYVKKNFFKFGRYSTWFYLQHMEATCNLPIEPSSMMLNDYSGSKSHRNGLLFVTGNDDLINEKLEPKKYEELEVFCDEFILDLRERYPELKREINFFTLETALCAFKKLFRKSRGRYLGYYLDRQAEEIKKVSNWSGIEWEVLWQARLETLHEKLYGSKQIHKEKMEEFMDTGYLSEVNWLHGDFSDQEGLMGLF